MRGTLLKEAFKNWQKLENWPAFAANEMAAVMI